MNTTLISNAELESLATFINPGSIPVTNINGQEVDFIEHTTQLLMQKSIDELNDFIHAGKQALQDATPFHFFNGVYDMAKIGVFMAEKAKKLKQN